MKLNSIHKTLVATAILLSVSANGFCQNKRMKDFVENFEKYQSSYFELAHSGKRAEAIAPLCELITLLDTTTFYKDVENPVPEGAIIEQKSYAQYDLACCYALTGQKRKALAALEESINNGYKEYNNMLNDNDLISLRNDKKYISLLEEVKGRSPLGVLKKTTSYSKDTTPLNAGASPFVYQPSESTNLVMVKEYFELEKVAGDGDELSKIINLLHFAHDNIRHDGSNRAFCGMDSIDLYNYCKTTGKGVNCRQLAISLCEMYLAMGIPARYVTCLPADPNDFECHVINTVWSSQLNKWLYIDPTMDAWVMDENGNLLSIAEVRERLIEDRPLVLCESANWNHENIQTKEGYLDDYMSKNLYYFVCKKVSRFNPESLYFENDITTDIRLIPVGFQNNNFTCDTTTDPDFFWASPYSNK